VVRSDTELLEAMASTTKPVLAVIDETAQELSGFGTSSKAAEEFSDSLTFIRKREESHGPHPKKGSVLMVNHTRKKTAKAFRDLASFGIEKPSRDDPGRAKLLDSEADTDKFEEIRTYKGISDTRERYDEHEASEFTIHGSDEEDGEESVDAGDVRRSQQIQTVVRGVKPWSDESGMSQSEAAALVDYSSSWVGDRVREWESGEHREVVADPRDESG